MRSNKLSIQMLAIDLACGSDLGRQLGPIDLNGSALHSGPRCEWLQPGNIRRTRLFVCLYLKLDIASIIQTIFL